MKSLPLRGRWQPGGLTEEGGTILPYLGSIGAMCCTSPAPFGGTLPKGDNVIKLRKAGLHRNVESSFS